MSFSKLVARKKKIINHSHHYFCYSSATSSTPALRSCMQTSVFSSLSVLYLLCGHFDLHRHTLTPPTLISAFLLLNAEIPDRHVARLQSSQTRGTAPRSEVRRLLLLFTTWHSRNMTAETGAVRFVCVRPCVCVWVFTCAIWHCEQINRSVFYGEVVYPKKVCENIRGRRVHAFPGVRVCEQKKDEMSRVLNKWQFDRRGVFLSLWGWQLLYIPFMRCVLVFFCQSVSLILTHTQKQRSHAHTYIHTHKEALLSISVQLEAGNRQAILSLGKSPLNCGLAAAERALCVTRYRYRLPSVTHK